MRKKRIREGLRRTGIEVVGEVPWGTHFCQFYETGRDLVETLVPYFREGLLANEFCMWVTAEPLKKAQAKAALKKAVPDLDRRIKNGQVEILDYTEWYTRSGAFEEDAVLQGWVNKLEGALERGYEGLRLTGNTFWLEKDDWADFARYERTVNEVIGRYKMLAVCTYSLAKCGAAEIADVIANHQFALLKRRGRWEIIESAEHKKTEQTLRESETKFRIVADNTHDFEFWIGPESRYVYASPACKRITGHEIKEFLAHPDLRLEIVHAADRPIFEKHIREEQSLRKPGEVDYRIVRPDGSVVWIGHACQPVFDAGGKFLGTRGSNRDITARKLAEENLKETAEELAAANEELRVSAEELQAQHEELQAMTEELQTQNDEILAAQERTQASEQRFRSLFSSMAEGAILHEIVCAPDGRPVDYRILEINPAGERIIGIPRKKAVGRLASRLYGTRSAPYLDTYARVAQTAKPESFDAYFAPMKRHFRISVFSPGKGQFATVFSDVTERKRFEETLRRAYDRTNRILSSITDGYFAIDRNWRFTEINPALCKSLGMSQEDLLGRVYWEVFPKTKETEFTKRYERAMADGTPSHFEAKSVATGIWFETHVYPAENGGLEVFLRDISDRKKNEETLAQRAIEIQKLNETLERRIDERTAELRSANEKLRQAGAYNRSLIEASLDPLVTIGADGKITDVNASTEVITGSPRDELIGTDFSSYFTEPDRARAGYQQVFRESHVRDFPLEIRSRDGRLTPVLYNATVYRDGEGQVAGVFAAARDITQSKQAEAEIAAANQKLRAEIAERRRLVAAVEQAEEGIAIMDPAGIVRYVNPAFARMCDRDRPTLGKSYGQILEEEETDPTLRTRIAEAFRAGGAWSGRMVRKKERDRRCDLDVTITPVRDDAGSIVNYLAVERDVTQEAQLEQHLRQLQKVEALGTLAGGIAHDFNNILNPIFINTELALCDARLDDSTRRSLETALKAAERGRDLVKQIITFSRQKEQERKPLQAAPLVKEALKFLRSSLPATIDIREDIEKETGVVMADPSQIHQLVMNLCGNAAHAMRENGGKLEVSLAEVKVDEETSRLHPDLKPGPYICLTVTDTGEGMTREVMERAFDPFFTTKKPGEGSGMGLAVVQGIVRNAGGAITVASEVGKGSSFNIFLPRIDTEGPATKPRPLDIPTGTERILLVDDEAVQVESVRMMLERLGYEVTAKTDSAEALALFAGDPARFDLVITDQTMPQLTGTKLIEEMVRLRPDVSIILYTGFSEMVDANGAFALGAREFLMKPFSMRDMAVAVRRALKE
jgi:PAS domain S-box-containing protein